MKITIKEIRDCDEWKTCSKCGEEKKLVFFSKCRDKRRPECKACDAIAYRNRKARNSLPNKSNTILGRFVSWAKSIVG